MMRRSLFSRVNKIMTAEKALKELSSGSKICIGGFGVCGTPHALAQEIRRLGPKDLICYSNTGGMDDWGIGILLQSNQIKRMVSSYIGGNKTFEHQYLSGELEVEFTPQGTLAERLRAGGAGIPAFYTATGYGTAVSEGAFPVKYNKDGTPAMVSEPRETRFIGGRWCVMEHAIKADFALIKAWKADKSGNCVFHGTAHNFNTACATAGKICVVEVEEIVENGTLDPNNIHLPGVYVHRIVCPEHYEKRIENLMVERKKKLGEPKPQCPIALELREKLARRVALEFRDGMYVNLGIGIPTLAANYIPPNIDVQLQSESGMLGTGPFPDEHHIDADLINAGKQTVSYIPTSSVFSSELAFAMIRGGHMDMTVLGGLQCAANGDLANWVVPGHMVKGMGGAMDLVSSGCRVVVTMEHTSKGAPKILNRCTIPITGQRVVDRIITDLCVFDVDKTGLNGLTLIELAPGVTVDQVKAKTEATFTVGDVKEMKYAGVSA